MTRRSSSATGTLITRQQPSLLLLLLVSGISGKCFEKSSATALGVILLEVFAELHHLIQDGSHETVAKENADDNREDDAIHRHRIELVRTHTQSLP